jgi:hypothetical protein
MLLRVFVSFLFIISLTFLTAERSGGYILPAEQLIEFMAKNFSGFRTLVISQSTRRQSQGEEERGRVFERRIWMESPVYFYVENVERTDDQDVEEDVTYRQLLMANSAQDLMNLLSRRMGINFESVAFARIDEIIAYRIGDKEPDRPKILIDKERFVPLLLIYPLPEDPQGSTIRIQFKDYRSLREGWYPFEIIYSEGGLNEISYIHQLRVNVPIDQDLRDVTVTRARIRPGPKAPEKRVSPEEEEGVRRLIRILEEKY